MEFKKDNFDKNSLKDPKKAWKGDMNFNFLML